MSRRIALLFLLLFSLAAPSTIRLKASALPEKEFANDTGVQLVDRLADLESRKLAVDNDLAKVREAILALMDKEKATVLAGSKHEIRRSAQETVRFPDPGETGWKGLEMVLREMGVLDRFVGLDTAALVRTLQDPETDRYLKAALEKFTQVEKSHRLRLVSKGSTQLRLFD